MRCILNTSTWWKSCFLYNFGLDLYLYCHYIKCRLFYLNAPYDQSYCTFPVLHVILNWIAYLYRALMNQLCWQVNFSLFKFQIWYKIMILPGEKNPLGLILAWINHLGLLFACLGELETMPFKYAEHVCNWNCFSINNSCFWWKQQKH